MTQKLETATFGGGCFWCVEAVFQDLKGVHRMVSGYAGGSAPNPTYGQVCTGATGHAEVVQIKFDPEIISFEDLLDISGAPTIRPPSTDRAPTWARSTGSVIFYHDAAQKALSERSKAETNASDLWPDSIVTEIAALQAFYPAEDDHQNYYRLNADQPYCRVVIDPKVRKLKTSFHDKLKEAGAR